MQQPDLRKVVAALLLQWVACGAVVDQRDRARETSVQTVIDLLDDTLQRTMTAKQTEALQYAAFKSWCTSTHTSRTSAIDSSTQEIEKLEAEIAQVDATTARLTREVLKHEQDVAAWKLAVDSAKDMHSGEAAHYAEERKAYSDAIDALERARGALGDKPAASLADVSELQKMAVVPAEAKRSLALFLGQAMRQDPIEVPAVAPYEVQSGGVIEILEELLRKFEDELAKLESEETTASKSFESFKLENAKESTAAAEQVAAKNGDTEDLAGEKKENEEKLEAAKDDKKGDAEFLAAATATCQAKASEFAHRVRLRTEEITAMEEAIKVLGSVTGTAGKLELGELGLFQAARTNRTKPPVLALLRAAVSGDGNNERRAQQFLLEQGQKLNSQILSSLASKIQDDDPLGTVKKLVHDLIVRLQEEAIEEAGHNGWCDTELATNTHTREDKAAKLEKLQATGDAHNVSILELTGAIGQLSEDIEELDRAIAAATTLRTQEKADNENTIKDAQEVQRAIANAMVILRRFYASATAFIQNVDEPEPLDAPEIFDSHYAVDSGTALDVLEGVSSKFGSLEVGVERDEAAAARASSAFVHASEVDKVVKQKDLEHKTRSKERSEQQLLDSKTELKRTQAELDAAEDYLVKLKPSCDAGVSLDERKQRREAEIQSLQKALQILAGSAGEPSAA